VGFTDDRLRQGSAAMIFLALLTLAASLCFLRFRQGVGAFFTGAIFFVLMVCVGRGERRCAARS